MVGNELVKVSGSPSPMLIWVFNQAANGKIPLFAEPAYSLFCSETIAKYRTISSSARQKAKIKRRISVKWRDERRRKSRDWELTGLGADRAAACRATSSTPKKIILSICNGRSSSVDLLLILGQTYHSFDQLEPWALDLQTSYSLSLSYEGTNYNLRNSLR